jgi:SAM-dependent methyltransferase
MPSPGDMPRIEQLLQIMPGGRSTVLEIGARYGYITRLLTEKFESVTALDLEKPEWAMDRVVTVAGDVQKLDFPDSSFDCVVCTEVLEHVPEVEAAARELARVVRHELIIGVPYNQDLRTVRNTCRHCGHMSNAWGHINSFDEARLDRLFAPLRPAARHYIGLAKGRTNSLSARLMQAAGNPWGAYNQGEPCPVCGKYFDRPPDRGFVQRLASAAAFCLNRVQAGVSRPQAAWVHVIFQKEP